MSNPVLLLDTQANYTLPRFSVGIYYLNEGVQKLLINKTSKKPLRLGSFRSFFTNLPQFKFTCGFWPLKQVPQFIDWPLDSYFKSFSSFHGNANQPTQHKCRICKSERYDGIAPVINYYCQI